VTLQAVSLRQYQEGQNVIVDGFIVRDHWDMTSDPSSVNEQILSADIKIYPNPVSGQWVQIESESSSPMHISVSDIEGREVLNTVISDGSMDVSGFNKGVYIVRIQQDTKAYSQKLVLH
jgi:plastocyanin domain-containing protein